MLKYVGNNPINLYVANSTANLNAVATFKHPSDTLLYQMLKASLCMRVTLLVWATVKSLLLDEHLISCFSKVGHYPQT